MPQQNPENYSVEEMMQRLKGRQPSESEELVTRADGTRMIKKRHRKRRSSQPEPRKTPRSTQSIRFIKLASSLAVAVLLMLGGFGLLAYHNSRSFVAKTEAAAGGLTGAVVKLDSFGVSPLRAHAGAVNLTWQDAGALREGRFSSVSAKVNLLGFLGGRWSGEELLAAEGVLRFGPSHGVPAAGAQEPAPYHFMRYRCAKLTAHFGPNPASRLSIAGAEATLYLRNDANQLRLNGGLLTAPGWDPLTLGRSRFLLKNDEVDVSLHGRDSVDGKGEMNVTGKVNPLSNSAALNVQVARFPFSGVVGRDLAQIIDGRVDSKAMVTFNPGDFSSVNLAASFEAASQEVFTMTSLPILAQLDREFGESALARPVFQSAQGHISRSAAGTRLSALRLEQRNIIAIQGDMAVDAAGKLSGSLEVGIAERIAVLGSSPQIIAAFSTRRDGFRWVSITLGGTAKAPTDSFKPLPAAASATPAPESPEEKLERQFKELTR
jgi:hypothetical protein